MIYTTHHTTIKFELSESRRHFCPLVAFVGILAGLIEHHLLEVLHTNHVRLLPGDQFVDGVFAVSEHLLTTVHYDCGRVHGPRRLVEEVHEERGAASGQHDQHHDRQLRDDLRGFGRADALYGVRVVYSRVFRGDNYAAGSVGEERTVTESVEHQEEEHRAETGARDAEEHEDGPRGRGGTADLLVETFSQFQQSLVVPDVSPHGRTVNLWRLRSLFTILRRRRLLHFCRSRHQDETSLLRTQKTLTFCCHSLLR